METTTEAQSAFSQPTPEDWELFLQAVQTMMDGQQAYFHARKEKPLARDLHQELLRQSQRNEKRVQVWLKKFRGETEPEQLGLGV